VANMQLVRIYQKDSAFFLQVSAASMGLSGEQGRGFPGSYRSLPSPALASVPLPGVLIQHRETTYQPGHTS
jgi:hypothetical protein